MTRPTTQHSNNLPLPPEEGARPSLDGLREGSVRPRVVLGPKDRLTYRQLRTADFILAQLRHMDRSGATDEEMADYAGVPVKVITEWRCRS